MICLKNVGTSQKVDFPFWLEEFEFDYSTEEKLKSREKVSVLAFIS